jgi:dTDP-4-amino-4,6-dideoxygalactose transaminase/acetyltransferase-like isoleucine patch superfamily enzyme
MTADCFVAIADDVRLGIGVKLSKFINLYGCEIGDASKIGAFVEIQKNARIGKRCKISSHTFICEGVTIEDNVFIGHGVTFINDSYPRATTCNGELQTEKDWRVEPTLVKKGASIGSGSTILSSVVIGENAIIGAGSVVTKDVMPSTIVAGNPARLLRHIESELGIRNKVMNDKVPFLDLATPHQQLEAPLMSVFREALKTSGFVGGTIVQQFERDFAEFCNADYCVGVSSGTDALRFALAGSGVRPGDVVVTVPNTFIATTEAISQVGAIFEFVDVDEATYNLDPAKLRNYLERQCEVDRITGKLISRRNGRPLTAVVPVHLYGQTADMDPIMDLAEAYNLVVIEDACQAHGAQYFSKREHRWKYAGTMGKAAAFSFYPGKNLGACGEAGAVTTQDECIAQTVRVLRDHGQTRKYHHSVEGYNGRLDAIQAGILSAKLPYLSYWNERRRQAAEHYQELLSSFSGAVILPDILALARPVWHLYVIRTTERDELRKHLADAGIDTGIHYPVPLHLQEAYRELGYREGDFPVTERVSAEIISLPMFPTLEAEQQRRVAAQIASFVSQSAGPRALSRAANS